MVEQEENASTPIVETNAQGLTITSYTQYENKMLLKIIEQTQQDIRAAITQQVDNKSYNLVFTAEENASGKRIVRIPLSKLEPRIGHRERAKQALLNMTKKELWIPYRKAGNSVGFFYLDHLFDVELEQKKQQIIVVFFFPIQALRYYLSIDLGYHYIDLKMLFNFRHNSTRQMYRVYKSYFALGKTTFLPLRLAVILSPRNSFVNYGTIKQSVLMVAKNEMDLAYQHGSSDIHFDFSIKTKHDDSCNPLSKKLVFTFYTRQDDELDPARKAELEAYQAKICFTLKFTFGVNEQTALDIASKVKIWMLGELNETMDHKMWYVKKKEAEGDEHFNKAGYIVKAMGKFFNLMLNKKNASEGKK